MILYQIFIYLLFLGIKVSSAFNPKNKEWLTGRKNWKSRIDKIGQNNENIIWIHVASLGEFEQGKPLIDKLFDNYPNYKILLTFFSPSGFIPKQNYSHSHFVEYLPLDTIPNMKYFVGKLNPKIAIFIKYEFWFNLLRELQKRKIPTFYVSAIFRENHFYFRPYAFQLKNCMQKITHYFVQNNESVKILNKNNIKQATIIGDTRFDTVFQNTLEEKELFIESNLNSEFKTIVYGSTWPEDEDIICEFIKNHPGFNHIIAPHEIEKKHINEIISKLNNEVSLYSSNQFIKGKPLIIDSIGVLKYIYKYADVSYIGGGFDKSGIHNTLEAVAFESPVVFGPVYDKFEEAKELIKLEIGKSISSYSELENALLFYTSPSNKSVTIEKCKTYINNNLGATEKVIKAIDEYL